MAIPATAAGRAAGSITTEASTRRLMAYAAGIGAEDECYFNDTAGIIGHPAFCVSLEWPVVSGDAYLAAIGRAPGAPRNAIHVLQDSRFHQPVRPGERVRTQATIAQVRATSAGVFVTTRVETVNAATSAPLVTTWTGAMFLKDSLEGAASSVEEPPVLRQEAAVTGASPASLSIQTQTGLAHRYSECASIWNPIHTERSAALAIGLPGVILHGTCTWALAGQALIHAVAGHEPLRLRRLAGRFKAMVIPGDRLELDYSFTKQGVCEFAVRTPRGDLALTHGVAEIAP